MPDNVPSNSRACLTPTRNCNNVRLPQNNSIRFMQNQPIQYENWDKVQYELKNPSPKKVVSENVDNALNKFKKLNINSNNSKDHQKVREEIQETIQTIHKENLRDIFRDNLIYRVPIQENDMRLKAYYKRMLNRTTRRLTLEEVSAIINKNTLREKAADAVEKTPPSSEKRYKVSFHGFMIPNIRRRINFQNDNDENN